MSVVEVRLSKKVVRGVTVADLRRRLKITHQAAQQRAARPGFPKPIVTITFDTGNTVKVYAPDEVDAYLKARGEG